MELLDNILKKADPLHRQVCSGKQNCNTVQEEDKLFSVEENEDGTVSVCGSERSKIRTKSSQAQKLTSSGGLEFGQDAEIEWDPVACITLPADAFSGKDKLLDIDEIRKMFD